jgi:predicted porin
MKKSLLALAALGMFAGAASAQSSVTAFGVVDLSLRYAKSGPVSMYTMANDGYNSSRLGFRGIEDLGGGLKASFWLEAGMDAGDGSVGGSSYTGVTSFFNRRATVSLSSGWGEMRLGRDYNATFWNLTIFDPFGTNGVGSSLNLAPGAQLRDANGNNVIGQTLVRTNNMVDYFLPGGLGGFYGQIGVAPSEGRDYQKYWGGRFGWAAGPFDVAYAYGETQSSINHDDYAKLQNIGASWDLKVAKLMFQWVDMSYLGFQQTSYMLGGTVPLGQGTIQASYVTTDVSSCGKQTAALGCTTANDANQFALGYVYNLSKRTALYTTWAGINNKGQARFTVSGKPQVPLTTAGGFNSQGYEFGLRHAF